MTIISTTSYKAVQLYTVATHGQNCTLLYTVRTVHFTLYIILEVLPNYTSLRLTIAVAENVGDGGEAIIASGLSDNTAAASISFSTGSKDKNSLPSD